RVAAARAVVMAELRRARTRAGPVVTGMVHAVSVGAAISRRSGQDVVLVWCIAEALDRVTFLRQCGGLADVVPQTRLFRGVPVQARNVLGDALTFGVVPRSGADTVARVDSRRAARTQVCVPGLVPSARCRCQRLALAVRTLQSTEVGALARSDAGHKEAH